MTTDVERLTQNYTCIPSESSYEFSTSSGVISTFGISEEKMPDFLKEYCRLALEDEENGNDGVERIHNLNIAEVLTDSKSPVKSTLVFKFDMGHDENHDVEISNSKFTKLLVYSYQRAFAEVLNISKEMREYIAVILETPTWTTKSTTNFSIELRFPYCQVDKTLQRTRLLPAIINSLRKNNVLSALSYQPIGDWDKIILKNDNLYPMYRSTTNELPIPRDMSAIYTTMESPDDEECEIDLHDCFDPKEHTYIHGQEFSGDFLKENDDVEMWIPIFLSAKFWNKTTTFKRLESKENNFEEENDYTDEESGEIDELSLACLFIEIIKDSTLEKYNYWCDVGKVLYNITYGSSEGLKLFTNTTFREKVSSVKIKIKKKTVSRGRKPENFNIPTDKKEIEKRTPKMCARLWKTFKNNNNLTIKTLAYMAKNDDIDEYKKWHNSWIMPAMNIALDEMTDVDMAEVIYRIFWLEFICSDIEKSKWWYFTPNTHRLISMNKAYKLRNGITDRLVPLLMEMRTCTGQQQTDLGNTKGKGDTKKLCETKIAQITKLIKKLKTASIRSRVLDMCKEKFYVENFSKIINRGGLCTAWPNCVVEVCGNEAIPRPGKLEDYLTKSGAISYNVTFSWTNDLVKQCMKYLSEVFPTKELLHHAIKDFSSFLIGKNAEKLFRVWTGNGNNSKSILVKLMQCWLGELCIDLPVSVYTGAKISSSGPSPELAQAEAAHLAITAEPDDGDDLKSGAIKRTTGGDRFFGRMCNSDGGSIDLTFKSIYMCNSIPNIPNVDTPTKERFGILPFLSKWVKTGASEDPEEQMRQRVFKMDEFFEEKIPDLAEALFWICVQYFPKYKKEGLKPPQIIIDYTNDHWDEHDPFQSFMGEKMNKVEIKDGDSINNGNSVTNSDLYPQFKNFFKSQYPMSLVPAAPQFKTQMEQRLGKQIKKRWRGWAIKDMD